MSCSVSEKQLMQYMAHSSKEKSVASTMTTYSAGIGCQDKLVGLVDTHQDFLVKSLLDYQRKSEPFCDKRVPISLKCLKLMAGALPIISPQF